MTTFSELFAGGAVFAVLASLWGYIKSMVWRLTSLFVQRCYLSNALDENMVRDYLASTYPYSRYRDHVFNVNSAYLRSENTPNSHWVAFESLGKSKLVFWVGRWPLFYSAVSASNTGNKTNSGPAFAVDQLAPPSAVGTSLYCLRGTIDVDAIIVAACKRYDELVRRSQSNVQSSMIRFRVQDICATTATVDTTAITRDDSAATMAWYNLASNRLLGHDPADVTSVRFGGEGSLLSWLFYPPEVLAIVRELETWRDNVDWYRARSIKWSRGWHICGKPGTGKTSLVAAIAQDLDLPVYRFFLSQLSDLRFMQAWREIQSNTPCIALFEDFDNVFHGRKYVGPPRTMPGFGWRGPASSVFARSEPSSSSSQPASTTGQNKEPDPDMMIADSMSVGFDTLLNCIDGVDKRGGIFLVITTNDPTKVDPALGGSHGLPAGSPPQLRPGRIDRVVELQEMQKNDMFRMARKLLTGMPQSLAAIEAWLMSPDFVRETGAQFSNRLERLALDELFRAKCGELPAVVTVQGCDLCGQHTSDCACEDKCYVS